MPDVLAGRVEPGRVFDREVTLDQTPQGYPDMDTRQTLGPRPLLGTSRRSNLSDGTRPIDCLRQEG
jgi:hypothetical protein